jgi:hypothetical protein
MIEELNVNNVVTLLTSRSDWVSGTFYEMERKIQDGRVHSHKYFESLSGR